MTWPRLLLLGTAGDPVPVDTPFFSVLILLVFHEPVTPGLTSSSVKLSSPLSLHLHNPFLVPLLLKQFSLLAFLFLLPLKCMGFLRRCPAPLLHTLCSCLHRASTVTQHLIPKSTSQANLNLSLKTQALLLNSLPA